MTEIVIGRREKIKAYSCKIFTTYKKWYVVV